MFYRSLPLALLFAGLLVTLVLQPGNPLLAAAPDIAEAPATPTTEAQPNQETAPPSDAPREQTTSEAPPETPPETPSDDAESAPPNPQEQSYLDAMREVEANGSAYDAALTQQLVGLGRSYQQAGNHLKAVEVLARAAHITRINEGLYSAADIPIIELLIESYAALGEWEEVDNRYQRMFEVYHHRYGGDNTQLLEPLQKLSHWHMQAYLSNIGDEPLNHLLAARNLYDSSIGIMRAKFAPDDPRLTQTLRESTLTSFYLAQFRPEEESGFEVGRGTQSPLTAANYTIQSFSSGRAALETIVAIRDSNPQTSAEERAQAMAELADWHLLFGRPSTAFALYRDAYAVAAQAQAPAPVADKLFDLPQRLPVVQASFELLAVAAATPDAPLLHATFVVNERGRAENIEITDSTPPAPKKQHIRFRKLLRSMLFRPRLVNGDPVPSDSQSLSYSYTP